MGADAHSMDRTKEYLTLAPFAALAIAVAYLQGYWGRFEVLAFPYLSFQELLAYSTVPFFGFLLFCIVGVFIGVLDSDKPTNKWRIRLWTSLFVIVSAAMIYFNRPEKWFVVPMILIALVGPRIMRHPKIRAVRDKSPVLVLVLYLMVILLIGTFGWGKTEADRRIKDESHSVRLTLDSGTETGKLLGKLGGYYFLLNASNSVVQLPEKAIQRIEYIKKHE